MAFPTQQGNRKGSTYYVQGSFAYLCYRKTEHELSLRCQAYAKSSGNCSGNAKIINNLLVPNQPHSCGTTPDHWVKISVKTDLKNKAENSSGPMKAVYNSVMTDAPKQIQASVTYPSINSSMKSSRRRNYPADPSTASGCAKVSVLVL
jgi:hypothetical protein